LGLKTAVSGAELTQRYAHVVDTLTYGGVFEYYEAEITVE
jgi:hypothetical protein